MEGHFNNGLTAAEAERLALLAEECAEVVQGVAKVLRHGYESHNPTSAAVSPSNREALAKEVGHVRHAIDRMTLAGDLCDGEIEGAKQTKADNISRWLHHQDGTPASTPDTGGGSLGKVGE